jgi:hypothetical protein
MAVLIWRAAIISKEFSKDLTFGPSCLPQPPPKLLISSPIMKSLAVTVLLIAFCFLGYDYFLAPPQDRAVFARPVVAQPPPSAPEVVETKVQQVVATAPVRIAPLPTTVAQAPRPAESTPVPKTPKQDSIEVLTENWQKVSRTAFPRPVNLVKDTTFNLSFGASTVRAGTQVIALNMDKGLLLIAPNEASAVRKSVPIDDTDLKSRLTAVYEKWKAERVEDARRQAEERKRLPAIATTGAVDTFGKPTRSGDGAYPLLLAKMRSGSPTDITPNSVIRWGNAEMVTIKGVPTWVIPVTYKTKTPFGVMDAETLAHVQKGQVVAWNFKGSGEPVP